MRTLRATVAFFLGALACANAAASGNVPPFSNLPDAAQSRRSGAPGGDILRAKLTASDGQVGDSFGDAVAIDGDTIVVGDDNASLGKGVEQGAAYVFVKPTSGWNNMTQTAKLTASDATDNDGFGSSVAVRGDTIVVGGYCHSDGQTCVGAVYVFVKPAAGWTDMTETAELTASDGQAGYTLGWSIGIDSNGRTIAAGALLANGAAGSVYVFVKPANGWANMTQNAELTASDANQANCCLGYSLSFAGDTVAAGDPGWANGNPDECCQGAAYIFVKPAKGWTNMTETAMFTASDGVARDEFGSGVSLDGGTLVLGALAANIHGEREGAVYVFLEPQSGWKDTSQFQAKLTSFSQTGGGLGISVGISGSSIIAGADGYQNDEGAAYAYLKPAGGWKTTSKYNFRLTDPGNQALAFFGAAVAQQGNVSLVGAYLENPGGAAYVYEKRH
jgi:hypothetical protein